MLALLDLTHQLVLRGFKITILVTPRNLPALNPLLSAHHPDSLETLVLPFPPHPDLPSGVEHVKDVGNSGNAPIIASLSKLEEPLIQWFQSHPSPPVAILSDFFLGWTQQWAEKLNIPRIAFFPTRVFLSSALTHLWRRIDSLTDAPTVEFSDLPRSPSFLNEHLPSIFKKYKKGDSDWEIVKKGMLANSESWGCVFTSFHALEGEYLDHMKEELGHGRVFGVGPLSFMAGSKSLRWVSPDYGHGDGVLTWLDKCPDGSVLYICFGSQKELAQPQIEAMAAGLERSRIRFVWVVKSNGWLPHGFEEKVEDQGLVVKGWAPQLKILSHKAVGGFLSHCGWNSLLESLEAGVMILGWPMEADQYVNARLFVEDQGLAVRVCEGGSAVPDPDELARIISESINGNIPQKKRARMMREKALEAVKAGGRSRMDLEELVKELSHTGVSKTLKEIAL